MKRNLRIVGRPACLLVLIVGALANVASGQMHLSNLFSDHAVLQRDKPIRVWGWSTPNDKITIIFHDQKVSTVADDIGCWTAWLMPEAAGGPFEMTVSGTSTVTVKDLLLGDVWLASGQSNMEVPLKAYPEGPKILDGDKVIANATQPQIRLLRLEHKGTGIPQKNFDAVWTLSTPETAADFSAVAYFFGKELNEHEHVAIGLIDATWGGSPIESWISLDALGQDASLMPVFAGRAKFANAQANTDIELAAEKKQDEAAALAHQPTPEHPWRAPEESWLPAGLYNGMISPLAGYSMKGAIWYQGESNSGPARAPLYGRLMSTLISDWRSKWQQGNFPFLFVQLSTWKKGDNWGTIRDAQRRSLAITNTAMAVSLDVGDPVNIHPPDKATVGARLALGARAIAYGEAVEYSGPLFRQVTTNGGTMRVWFDHAAGLHARGGQIEGFEVAGDDGVFVDATAVIDGNTVILRSSVSKPVHVRYGWAPYSKANLYNEADLPAPAFVSE